MPACPEITTAYRDSLALPDRCRELDVFGFEYVTRSAAMCVGRTTGFSLSELVSCRYAVFTFWIVVPGALSLSTLPAALLLTRADLRWRRFAIRRCGNVLAGPFFYASTSCSENRGVRALYRPGSLDSSGVLITILLPRLFSLPAALRASSVVLKKASGGEQLLTSAYIVGSFVGGKVDARLLFLCLCVCIRVDANSAHLTIRVAGLRWLPHRFNCPPLASSFYLLFSSITRPLRGVAGEGATTLHRRLPARRRDRRPQNVHRGG